MSRSTPQNFRGGIALSRSFPRSLDSFAIGRILKSVEISKCKPSEFSGRADALEARLRALEAKQP